ncbi:Fatty aldehyde dehydrogenase HFD1 [Nakaseomyces bracarensis]|uniref:Aldehyde dehydrogenase n=1 Tax=Nakaseomyces bracarensis TaxID=273131 RepID=A0ABR4NN32_9SACH
MLRYTPLDEIEAKLELSKDYFLTKQRELSKHRNVRKEDVRQRTMWLKKLYWSVKDHEEQFVDALYQDFHRSPLESVSFEYMKLLGDILHLIEGVPKWIKPRKVKDNSPAFMFGKIRVEKIARGSVLVVAPFNFPIMLALTPVAIALASGNSVILKPSEQTPNCALFMEEIIRACEFPEGLVQVVQGAVEETQKLVRSPTLDMIFYTGSPRVGSLIAQDAAKNLTPCVLELGGKSPTFVTEHLNRKNLRTALKRIFFGAFGNSGQICVSPDYVLMHESLYEEAVQEARILMKELFPQLDEHTEYTHMIHEAAYNRTVKKLENSQGRKISAVDCSMIDKMGKLLIPPTIVFDVEWDDPLMQEENFAPVLPIIKYSNLDSALDKILATHDTPLVQYIFSENDHEIEQILTRLRSGDCIIGDTMIHVGIKDIPFGGIGQSGYGNYGGIYGFDAFTHDRVILKQPYWVDILLQMRYPPFNKKKLGMMKLALGKRPWFDRDGKDHMSLQTIALMAASVTGLAVLYKIITDSSQ